MKTYLTRFILGLTMVCSAFSLAPAQRVEAPLTNTSVIKLVRAGFKEKTVIAIIHNRPSNFNLDPDRLIELKRNGVSDNIILAMLSQDESFVMNDDEWSMGSTLGRKRGDDGHQRSGTDIFGGSSGSKGSNSGRGMSGANENETTTTGTATVRILRPPSETGGGTAMKLEKTPTLDNEAVIKLVEAGFSEGTIIKRIQDSPADFDLSNAKLEELRRRRVTDPIIAAMTAAMGDEDSPKLGRPVRPKGN